MAQRRMINKKIISKKIFKTEKQLEIWISENLINFEEGLTLVCRQKRIYRVFTSQSKRWDSFDILAIDRNGIDVIIEVKLKNADKICVYWQIQPYKHAWRNIDPNVRTIIVSTSFNENIYLPAQEEGVELWHVSE